MGAGGVKNFSVGICDGAPSTARSSLSLYPFLFLSFLNRIKSIFLLLADYVLFFLSSLCYHMKSERLSNLNLAKQIHSWIYVTIFSDEYFQK